MFEVVYSSRSGNTRKVAEAIAAELEVAARDAKTAGILDADAFIFLGMGCYGGTVPADISEFMEINRFNRRKIAFFTTSGFGLAAERGMMENSLMKKGAVITHNYKCYGRMMGMKKDHPTAEEINNARVFARTVAAALFPERNGKNHKAGIKR